MRIYSWLLLLPILFNLSCSNAQSVSNTESNVEYHDLRSDKEKALDALTHIQVTGDGKMMLYLTFPNISHQECQGTVHEYEISQAEFQNALLEVMKSNNLKFSDAERTSTAARAAHPEKRYRIKACGLDEKTANGNPPRKGTWIIPAIFGESDVVINW